MQVSKNFTDKELECPCCGGLVFDEKFIVKLQALRDFMQKPFHITSGYRCRFRNEKLGGFKNSRHLHGSAVDVRSDQWCGATKWEFVKEALHQGLSVGIYDGWFHVDLRPGSPVLFYGKK
jgi:uncharacterized protein YcbK (DUF882 family)